MLVIESTISWDAGLKTVDPILSCKRTPWSNNDSVPLDQRNFQLTAYLCSKMPVLHGQINIANAPELLRIPKIKGSNVIQPVSFTH